MSSPRQRPERMDATPPKSVIVCTHLRSNPAQPSCGARRGQVLAERLSEALQSRGLDIRLETFACLGHCDAGPNVKLSPGGALCNHQNPDDLDALLREIEAFAASPDISTS